MTQRPESLAILRDLASKRGDHDAVKANFRALLVAEFDVPLGEIRFEQRVEVKSRIDALIGQPRGQWGARHFDKVVFNLPIPRYDSKIKLHRDLAAAAERAERVAAAVALPEGVKFQRARALVRTALTEAGISKPIDALVAQLLDGK